MAFHTFGPGLALDEVTGRGIPAVVAQLTDAETGDPVQAYTMDDEPIETTVSTNRYGYFGQFQVDESVRRLRLTFGGLTLEHTAWQLLTEAAQDAERARIAAELAAALVDAPADDAVAALLANSASLSATAGDARWVTQDGVDQAVSSVLETESEAHAAVQAIAEASVAPILAATSPLAYLDNVKLVAQFPVRESGETSWIQGFTIMFDEGRYYVSNQEGNKLRVDRRELGSNSRSLARTITTENNAFSETIDAFRDVNGDLIFVIWPKAMAFPGAYALYNMSKMTVGPQIPINGLVRGARYGDIFVTCDVWGNNAPSKFYIYSWESIKNSAPVLLQEITCKAYPNTPAKTQGIGYNDGFIFFAQGSQTENMTITVYNTMGDIEMVKVYDRSSLMRALNKLSPGLLTNPNYLFETEGAYVANGKLYTLQIVNDTPETTANAVALILEHNNIDGVKIESTASQISEVGPWKNVDLLAGWTHQANYPFQARVNGNRVEFQGYAVNASFVGGYTQFGNLPEGIPKPKSAATFSVPGNTPASRAIVIYGGGGLEAYTSAATGAWYGISGGYAY